LTYSGHITNEVVIHVNYMYRLGIYQRKSAILKPTS